MVDWASICVDLRRLNYDLQVYSNNYQWLTLLNYRYSLEYHWCNINDIATWTLTQLGYLTAQALLGPKSYEKDEFISTLVAPELGDLDMEYDDDYNVHGIIF